MISDGIPYTLPKKHEVAMFQLSGFCCNLEKTTQAPFVLDRSVARPDPHSILKRNGRSSILGSLCSNKNDNMD